MKKQYAAMIRKAGAMLLGASVAFAASADAGGPSAYVTDAHGSAIRNANYLCWHTGFWTPAAAVAECDPDLVARPAPVTSVPPAPSQPSARRSATGKPAPSSPKKGSAAIGSETGR